MSTTRMKDTETRTPVVGTRRKFISDKAHTSSSAEKKERQSKRKLFSPQCSPSNKESPSTELTVTTDNISTPHPLQLHNGVNTVNSKLSSPSGVYTPKLYPGGSTSPALPRTPLSERQQMALLIQMTADDTEDASHCPSPVSVDICTPTRHRSPAESRLARRLHKRNERGETPLHVAAIKGDLKQVRKLLRQGADVNCTDFAGWYPIHEACNHGWLSITKCLIKSGASVNSRGLDNDTPLHDAAGNGHLELVKLLLSHGAEQTTNSRGKTPYQISATTEIAALLSGQQAISPYWKYIDSPTGSPVGESDIQLTEESEKGEEEVSPECILQSTLQRKNKKKVHRRLSCAPRMDEKGSSNVEMSSENQPPSEDHPESNTTEDEAKDGESTTGTTGQDGGDNNSKRKISDVSNGHDDESKVKKKKKEESVDNGKENSGTKNGSNTGGMKMGKNGTNKKEDKSCSSTPGGSPKSISSNKGSENADSDGDDKKSTDLGPKVPPLKIVIPSSTGTDQEQGVRNGNSRHQALPYVVTSTSDDKDETVLEGDGKEASGVKPDDKNKDGSLLEPERSLRVTRSSHRAAQQPTSGTDSGSDTVASLKEEKTDDIPTDVHPRKRKIKARELVSSEPIEPVQPIQPPSFEPPVKNCYERFLDIRSQVERRRRNLFAVQPKPPTGFENYLMNRCTYVLAGRNDDNLPVRKYPPPQSVTGPLRDLFIEQENERYKVRLQHLVEGQKLVLSVEQEILRVHGRAARALANQSLPFSVCTILKDEEVYNPITPEQEEKDRNARSRYNGRLFISWLQDVDDKWDKIKENMLQRHQNEADSLHAIQRMDWEWKMKELGLCDPKATPVIEEILVPSIQVSDIQYPNMSIPP